MQPESTQMINAIREIDAGAVIAVIAILGGFTIAMVSIVGGIYSNIRARREREETKRELAAYVAEGSLTPDQAERLIRADDHVSDSSDGPERRRRRRMSRESREFRQSRDSGTGMASNGSDQNFAPRA